jgi:YtkA-like protein
VSTGAVPAARPLVTPRRAAAAAAALVVLALLGWLLWPHGTGRTVLYAGTSRYAATVTVDNPRVGTTDVSVALATRAGAPVGNAALLLQATQPLMGMATPAIPATSTGTGRYDASGVPLMMTGPWQLLLTVTGPTGTVDTLQVPLTVTG